MREARRIRLDLALEARGLIQSRARARDAVNRGTVQVNGQSARKPGQLVSDADEITIDDPAARYVSRAALKLIAGLDAAQIDPTGQIALDLGASTGGFTEVLLERGAARVYAVDVGHDQLHQRIAEDPRVISLEGQNAKSLDRDLIPDPISLIVCDISFVSLLKVLKTPLRLVAPGAHAVLLIKPQFEVGRDYVGKGGIVTDPAAIAGAIAAVTSFMADAGWQHLMSVASPITGGDGNQETVSVFALAASGS
ncbi:TlyA family RNA methyltransferase [Devosia sp.]|uniref:TlyA family RNA methyltransferase n=1 Tax=Devosia sp. TaxID=1871048 RepID=UPI003A91106F